MNLDPDLPQLVRLFMRTAVFDFDETLIYLPSVLIWHRKISLKNKLQFPFLFLLEKIDGIPRYHEMALKWMVGKDISNTIGRVNDLPPVPGGIRYFRHLAAQGFKMIVMSYTPGVFVNPWLDANDLTAELICPNFVMYASIPQMISDDSVTNIYLKEPSNAKAKILEKMNIKPDICVGNDKRRDGICDRYVDIRQLEPQYKNNVQQVLSNLQLFF